MCTPSPDWFTSGSLSFELMKGLPAVVVTGLITAVLGYLAIQIQKDQWRVSRAKLSLDLFDKRYKIFEATWTELSQAIQRGPVGVSNPNFTNLLPQAQFLFGLEIRNYMSEIASKTTELWMIQKKIEANQNILPPDLSQRNTELMEWFSKHAIDECRARFGPYLDFSKWTQ